MLDKNIKLFKLYKMNAKLNISLDNFNKQQTKYLLPILYIGDDIIFGEVRAQDKTKIFETTNLYNDKNKKSNLALYYKDFYRMDSKILKEHIDEDEQTISLGYVSEKKELEILEKLKYCFSKEDTDTKLTYIYPKKIEEENLEESKAKEIKISEREEYLKQLKIKEPILYDSINQKEIKLDDYKGTNDKNAVKVSLYYMLSNVLKDMKWTYEKGINNLTLNEFKYEADAKLERLNNLDWDALADYYTNPDVLNGIIKVNNCKDVFLQGKILKDIVKGDIKEKGAKSVYFNIYNDLKNIKDEEKYIYLNWDQDNYGKYYVSKIEEVTNEFAAQELINGALLDESRINDFHFIVESEEFNRDYLNKQEQKDNQKLEKGMVM
ncbi:hypothetical protein [Mycoplasma sp. 4423]